MTIDDLLPLLSPLALAALEAGLTDSLDEMLSDDSYQLLLATAAAVREYGHSLLGDDYAYLAGSVCEQLDELTMYIS
jgi:hypothetical protein